MKTKKIIIAIGFLTFLVACKNKKNDKSTTSTEENKPAIKENFNVELDVKTSKKDDLSLYYTEDNTIAFTGDMVLWHGVAGGNTREKIVFDLSEEKIPTDIRLDFGMNKEQDSVEVYNVKVSYYGNELAIKGSDFFNYFIESKDFKTAIDVKNGSLKIYKNGPEYKTPFFYPRQELIDAIKKLTTASK
jgi:hypothetical protein